MSWSPPRFSRHAAPAAAQTLLPDIPFVGDDEKPPKPQDDDNSVYCGGGSSLLCTMGSIPDAAGGIVSRRGAAADAVMGGIVDWAAGGAAWLVKSVAGQIDRSTRPALGSAWFSRQYAGMRELAVALSLLFLLAAIVQAVARQDLAMLLRACLVALPLALLLTFAAVTLVELGLLLTDALTEAALQRAGGDIEETFADLVEILAPTSVVANPLPGLVLFLGALLTAALALVVWIELVLREAAIYVTVVFLPIALAAVVWPRTAHWARRLAEWLAAIILAKFTIAVSFATAGAMVAHGRPGEGGLSALLAGCAVLLIAAFSPWVLLRLIPFAEQAVGSLHRGQVGAAMKTAPGAAASTLLVRQAMFKSFGAGLAASAVASSPRPWKPAAPAQAPRERPAVSTEGERYRSTYRFGALERRGLVGGNRTGPRRAARRRLPVRGRRLPSNADGCRPRTGRRGGHRRMRCELDPDRRPDAGRVDSRGRVVDRIACHRRDALRVDRPTRRIDARPQHAPDGPTARATQAARPHQPDRAATVRRPRTRRIRRPPDRDVHRGRRRARAVLRPARRGGTGAPTRALGPNPRVARA